MRSYGLNILNFGFQRLPAAFHFNKDYGKENWKTTYTYSVSDN